MGLDSVPPIAVAAEGVPEVSLPQQDYLSLLERLIQSQSAPGGMVQPVRPRSTVGTELVQSSMALRLLAVVAVVDI